MTDLRQSRHNYGWGGRHWRGSAKLFTDEGAKVLLADRNESALQRVVDTLGSAVASHALAMSLNQPRYRGMSKPHSSATRVSTFCSPTPVLKASCSPLPTIPLTSSIRSWPSMCAASGWGSSMPFQRCVLVAVAVSSLPPRPLAFAVP